MIHFLELKAGYLFPEIAKRVKLYSQSEKGSNIIKLGLGDVTEPLPRSCIEAMGKALDAMHEARMEQALREVFERVDASGDGP